jgi:hypothetical protein
VPYSNVTVPPLLPLEDDDGAELDADAAEDDELDELPHAASRATLSTAASTDKADLFCLLNCSSS